MEEKTKILIVDDEKRFVESLRNILRHYGYDCTAAYEGSEAIEYLRNDNFEIALLDVVLPDISGCSVADFIKKTCKSTTVIMLTGLNTVNTAVEAMKKGAYDFLSKPVNPDCLLKTLEKAKEHNDLKKALKISEKRFRTLAQVAWESIVIHDKEQLLEANEQFYSMFGYRKEELIGENFYEKIFTPESIGIIEQHCHSQDAAGFEVSGTDKDGKKLHVEMKCCSIEYLGRSAQVMIMRDISNRVRSEQEKLHFQEKLAQASKLNALGLMAGSVAHDLNNILTAVVSYPDLLLAQMDRSDRYYNEIKKIQEAGKQAVSVVADLVSIARGGVRKTEITDLNQLIMDHLTSIEHSERLQHFPNVFVQIKLHENLADIECSPQHIKKVLSNLIGNSLESIHQNGTVRLETEMCKISKAITNGSSTLKVGDYVKLTIADDGPGIDPEHIENIFTPFFTTKEKKKSGTGLGLSIVWNVIREHKGWINVKNLHPGVSFEILFPPSAQKASRTYTPILEKSLVGKGEKILVVDDEPNQIIIMEKMLDILGYKPISFTNGEEAVNYLRDNQADLVFLDMMMGDGINGRETYEKILEISPMQKAVILSGYCDMSELERARGLGVLSCLEKPVSLQKLGKIIQDSLSS
ncbi:MAG: response regulator [Desulfopila sp.]|jgi:PAS domain S-box-containing protein|nr:response regulator [Desulfopila sp.]